MRIDEISELRYYGEFTESYIQYSKGDWRYRNGNPEFRNSEANRKQNGCKFEVRVQADADG